MTPLAYIWQNSWFVLGTRDARLRLMAEDAAKPLLQQANLQLKTTRNHIMHSRLDYPFNHVKLICKSHNLPFRVFTRHFLHLLGKFCCLIGAWLLAALISVCLAWWLAISCCLTLKRMHVVTLKWVAVAKSLTSARKVTRTAKRLTFWCQSGTSYPWISA